MIAIGLTSYWNLFNLVVSFHQRNICPKKVFLSFPRFSARQNQEGYGQWNKVIIYCQSFLGPKLLCLCEWNHIHSKSPRKCVDLSCRFPEGAQVTEKASVKSTLSRSHSPPVSYAHLAPHPVPPSTWRLLMTRLGSFLFSFSVWCLWALGSIISFLFSLFYLRRFSSLLTSWNSSIKYNSFSKGPLLFQVSIAMDGIFTHLSVIKTTQKLGEWTPAWWRMIRTVILPYFSSFCIYFIHAKWCHPDISYFCVCLPLTSINELCPLEEWLMSMLDS